MPQSLRPGFIALHSNRSENLVEAIAQWLAANPLGPLEEEVILVQSNAMAEWLKMELASRGGVCAATRVELPARFLWRTYRQVLGRDAVPADSPLDKIPMTWRIMKLLPDLLGLPEFAPVRGFLRADEPDRTLQLAARLADQFDQYQIYRARWLGEWAAGRDVLIPADGKPVPVPADQSWQPVLWRALLDSLEPGYRAVIRPQLEDRFLARLERDEPLPDAVARRITVFGVSQFPLSSLRAIAALSRHRQVLLAVFNPCQFFWADIIAGGELLRSTRRRHALRGNLDLSSVPEQEMHHHANPLLASWGRQSRDFVRQLDAFDDAERARRDFDMLKIDFFDDDSGQQPTLLRQVQDNIRDLVPVADTQARHIVLAPGDRSICFQIAHSKVRELEILHDHLLGLLADRGAAKPGQEPLQPRDIVVMVPDIEQMAPAVRAVFGQYRRDDPRHIPFDISDLGAKTTTPLIGAVDWLLALPQQRCRMSELVDLLEVPAIAARFGIRQDDLPRLTAWMVGAGIRWGLDADHRAKLGLAACGDQNSALFGLHRMLLGYCSGLPADEGSDTSFHDIEPYAELGGLDAALAGSLAHLLQLLRDWWSQAIVDATPDVWAERGRHLLAAIAAPTGDADRQAIQSLSDALTTWRDACERAGFTDALPLAVVRSAWLNALNLPSLSKRFRAGGVTFCSLMPLRVVPFEVVCLLGMNDGDYPRHVMRSDFDLMGLAGMALPGDRSRRDDDRQLMLEALLSARWQFYVSWSGRSVRDNSEQPASVLVSQLRDYLAAGWGPEAVSARTQEHPLQPFSRQYFERGSTLVTYAREWRAAHDAIAAGEPPTPVPPNSPSASFSPDRTNPLTIVQLARFLRNPVKAYFKMRLSVVFDDDEQEDTDEESWGIAGLDRYGLLQELLDQAPPDASADQLRAYVARALRQMRLAGRLPISGMGEFALQELDQTVTPMLMAWSALCRRYDHPAPRQSARIEAAGAVLEDWLENLRYGDPVAGQAPTDPQLVPQSDSQPDSQPGSQPDSQSDSQTDSPAVSPAGSQDQAYVWLQLEPVRLCDLTHGKVKDLRPEKLIGVWLRSLCCAVAGIKATGFVVDQNAVIEIHPVDPTRARATLQDLLALWVAGMSAPLPLPLATSIAVARQQNAIATYEGGYDNEGEVQDMCFARVFPDYEALEHDGELQRLAPLIHGQLIAWIGSHCVATAHQVTP